MDHLLPSFESFLPTVQSGLIPPVDIYEKGNDIIVETPLAGIEPEDLEITVSGGYLSIKGSTERKTEVDEKNYYRKEVRSGTIQRTIPLPAEVEEGKAEAELHQGMLRIQLPRLKAAVEDKPVKINVKKIN